MIIFPARKTTTMKKIHKLLLFATALLLFPFLQSCNDDDDNSGGGPSAITYPHSISFSHFENVEFKMWTNGAEVNTTGMDFLGFVEDEEDAYDLSSEYYESIQGFTFTEDSLFATGPDGSIEMYPYFMSDDSLFVVAEISFPVDTFIDVFMGLGSPAHLRLVEGFTQFCNITDGELTIVSCGSTLRQKFYTLDSALDEYGTTTLDYIEEGDTLIVNNRYVHLQ